MIKKINDDFNLDKIIQSGQCFRAQKINNDEYQFITLDKILRIKKISSDLYDFSCSENEFNKTWFSYFDFKRNYKELNFNSQNSFINDAIEFGKGIRILRQDPWETLISFIISQNKNIPAIKNSIELLSKEYGHPIFIFKEKFFPFPSSKELSIVTEKDLNNLKLGYRSKYVLDAIEKVNSNEINLINLNNYSDSKLVEELIKIKGVGNKVANCIGLFSYGRTSLVPQDVWIKRTIQEEFNGINLFNQFGSLAGIIQQFIFYYQRNKSS